MGNGGMNEDDDYPDDPKRGAGYFRTFWYVLGHVFPVKDAKGNVIREGSGINAFERELLDRAARRDEANRRAAKGSRKGITRDAFFTALNDHARWAHDNDQDAAMKPWKNRVAQRMGVKQWRTLEPYLSKWLAPLDSMTPEEAVIRLLDEWTPDNEIS